MKTLFAALGAILLGATLVSAGTVGDLSCEYLRNPRGIDALAPRLSWAMASDTRGDGQSAYQVVVASSPERLAHNEGDLWDSGKILSSTSIHVPYAGRPLETLQDCFWKVRLWDIQGRALEWSEPARWSMGVLQPGDWKAKWIGQEIENPTLAWFKAANWIWFAEQDGKAVPPLGVRFFRKVFDLSGDESP